MQAFLDFEAPVAELEGKIAELRAIAQKDASVSIADDVKSLETKASKILNDLYAGLTPWQKTQRTNRCGCYLRRCWKALR